MRLLTLVALLLAVDWAVLLGKSDRKVVIEEYDEDDEEVEDDEAEDLNAQFQELLEKVATPRDSVTKNSILDGHSKLDSGPKKFAGATLAYITPWNNKGYDLAKVTAHKLDYVSPVWLQMKPQTADHSMSCRIEGSFDIDHDWMSSLWDRNPKLKIVPRILFEEWSNEDLGNFLVNEQWQRRCLDDLANLLQRNRFNGAVIEFWSDAALRTRGRAIPYLVEMFKAYGNRLKKSDMELIITVRGPVTEEGLPTGMFTAEHLLSLGEDVSHVQLMTYDYPSRTPSAVAPISWVHAAIKAVTDGRESLAEKVMIGLNFYGYNHKSSGSEAIKFDQYLDLLKKKESSIEWDNKSMEHYVKVGRDIVYFPSLTSIELRVALAAQQHVGIGIWDYGQGLDYFTQAL